MKLAVIGTFYRRHKNSFPLLHRLLVDSTRVPDEAWLMCEDMEDAAALSNAFQELYEMDLLPDDAHERVRLKVYSTPKTESGEYAVIPYSNKINYALDHTSCDAIVYLDNGSMPGPHKYEEMLRALEDNPKWGAVYCTQKRTGFSPMVEKANRVVEDAFCVLNYTQVMHRKSKDRWTLDMRMANPDLADADFWRQLHKRFGSFYPAGGDTVHDDHHIPSPAAVGI